MALSDSVRQIIISRGYSSSEIDGFLENNPGDEGRILSAFPPQSSSASTNSSSSSAPSSSSGSPTAPAAPAGTPPAPGGGVVTPTGGASPKGAGGLSPALSGLAGVSPALSAGNVGTPMEGVLRPYLGTRTIPQDSSALASLRRIY